jgi:CheY-like chemotaxis protein
MMGGEITVASTVGEGATFTMQLPAIVAAPAAPVQPETALDTASAIESALNADIVLVIDDDPTVHDLMKRFLTKEGFAVKSAINAQEGLRLARELHPAVITLDVMMPDVDGWAALSALKSDPELAEIPVIVLTMVDNKNMGYALGASDYLTKPIDRARLTQVLAKYRCDRPPCPLMLVEDDSTTRQMMKQLLEKAGWEVVEAENGRVALEKLAQCQPELILLDLMMPELDGFEFVAELQQQEAWRSLPVIVLTAKDITPADQQQLRGYVEQILQKGAYSQEQLLSKIRSLVTTSVKPKSDNSPP